jgi:tetratricopeptide (TPR) repeat protein
MEIKTRLKNLIQAARLYRSQGLLVEAKQKYKDALDLIQGSEWVKNRQNIIDNILKKFKILKKEIEKIEKQPALREVPKKEQDLIKELFSDSKGKDKDEAAIEGAITLAKFGQFERAMEEFNELLEKAATRVDAAKNILRCHMARTTIDDAVTQFQKWQSNKIFTSSQLLTVRLFLEVFRYDNLKDKTPIQLRNVEEVEEIEIQNGNYPDICAMIIILDEGPLEGGTFILDVNFQTGNVITLFIDGHKEELLENFKVGKTLDNVQFQSTIAILRGNGVVKEKIKMESGLREGDYRLDILVTGS